jgi:hypothetical protein
MANNNMRQVVFESSQSSVMPIILFDPCDNPKGKCSHSCFAEKRKTKELKPREAVSDLLNCA